MTIQSRCPTSSPWGRIQTTKKLGAGIWQVTTACHGGIYVDVARYGAMPAYLKTAAKYAGPQWFEEDCEWALVALAYPGCFAKHREQAVQTVKDWYPETWAKYVETERRAAIHAHDVDGLVDDVMNAIDETIATGRVPDRIYR